MKLDGATPTCGTKTWAGHKLKYLITRYSTEGNSCIGRDIDETRLGRHKKVLNVECCLLAIGIFVYYNTCDVLINLSELRVS